MDDTTGLVSRIASNTDPEVRQKGLQGVNLYSWRSNYLYYDLERTYGPEINKALARAKRILKNHQEDFEELTQDVHFAIWDAQQHYGDRMNAALAYQIAKNQAATFLRKRIKSQTIVDTDAEGNPVLDEFGLARGLDGAELKRQSKDPNATPEERKRAKKLIWEYGRTIPRSVSLDAPESQENEGDTVRLLGDRLLHDIEDEVETNRFRDFLHRDQIAALRQLVSTWQGDKRRVAEAMLEPDFTVRSVPGLDKSKVSRIRQGVREDFRTFLNGSKH